MSKPKIDAFITHLRSDSAISRIGVVGFCWGGRHAILQATKDSEVDVVAVCHPALTAIADYEPIEKPISFAFGDHDLQTPMTQVHEIIDVLEKKTELLKEIRIYEDQVHGFTVRGDFSDEKDKKAMDDSAQQVVDWFKKYL